MSSRPPAPLRPHKRNPSLSWNVVFLAVIPPEGGGVVRPFRSKVILEAIHTRVRLTIDGGTVTRESF